MPLLKNKAYLWAEILRETGAGKDLPYYLLRPPGSRLIVAAALDITLNARAPYEIWAGTGRDLQRWADALDRQVEAFPVFVREGNGRYYYRGRFQRVGSTMKPFELSMREMQAGLIGLYKIIFLKEVAP